MSATQDNNKKVYLVDKSTGKRASRIFANEAELQKELPQLLTEARSKNPGAELVVKHYLTE